MSETRAIVERGIKIWNAHDLEGWVDLGDPKCELSAPGGLTARGKEGFRQFYAMWNDAFPDNQVSTGRS